MYQGIHQGTSYDSVSSAAVWVPNRAETISARIRLTDSVRPWTPTALSQLLPNPTLFVRAQSLPGTSDVAMGPLGSPRDGWEGPSGVLRCHLFHLPPVGQSHSSWGIPRPRYRSDADSSRLKLTQHTHRMTSTAQNDHMAYPPH